MRTTTLLVAILVAALLSACGAAPTPELPAPTTPVSVEQPSGVTVLDALGRTVQLPRPPQRIVVAGKSTIMIIDALYLFPEARDRIAGVSVGKQKPGDFLQWVDAAFEQKQTLDPEAGAEQIAPLTPDLVVLKSFMADKLGKSLEQIGLPVVYLDLETPEQFVRDLATIGQIFANPARAEQLRSLYDSRQTAIEAALQGIDAQQKPSALILQYTNQGGEIALNVPSAAWMQTILTEMAGGAPVWQEAAQAGGWTVVNFEQIAAWDPATIFVVSYGPNPSEVVTGLKADAKWQALRAVKEGRLYAFPGDYYSWDQPDPRWILGVTWLAAKLHPDRFPGLSMTQQVVQFFGEIYAMDETSIQAHILPMLKGDVQ